MKTIFTLIALIVAGIIFVNCNTNSDIIHPIKDAVCFEENAGAFLVADSDKAIPILYCQEEYSGVIKTIKTFSEDIERVCSSKPAAVSDIAAQEDFIIIVGTRYKNPIIDSLIDCGKLRGEPVTDKWESSLIQIVKNPIEGVKKALIIAGSDKRGTIFGLYSLSRAMGVSPWYWWADVPVKQQEKIYIKPGIYSNGEPSVQYRGIFINDEAPALAGWVEENYGAFNHRFYEKVFELLLRHNANFLWPAMWGRSFNMDDTLNPVLADEFGIVMGTSHHEPMNRAHADWEHYGQGPWDYSKNAESLNEFWQDGLERTNIFETIVTLGMRGDGDEPMSEESNIELLKSIVSEQRSIIEKVTNQPVNEQPQVWALYKEVLEYYHKGMRVPEDVTLLLCDDNWGNVRYLPSVEEQKHPGGYGMYYHFDYVGGPRNYKWINKSNIPRIWEQMDLTYRHGVNKIWIVNVGDIKPMELPISFILDYAWKPEKWPLEKMSDYTRIWSLEQFGRDHANEITQLLDTYCQYNSRRTAEMLDENTYSLLNYREFERVTDDYKKLEHKTDSIAGLLPIEYLDSYFQLVQYPIKAMANLYEMYYNVALNNLYYSQQRSATNITTEKVYDCFAEDSLLSLYYNTKISDGKWSHMMDQVHIGYTWWQQPDKNIVPETKVINPSDKAVSAISIEGSTQFYLYDNDTITLQAFNNYGADHCFFELFNQGNIPFSATVQCSDPWLNLSYSGNIKIDNQQRIETSINWSKVPSDTAMGYVNIVTSDDKKFVISIKSIKNSYPDFIGFVPTDGYLSFDAVDYSKKSSPKGLKWQIIPGIGRTSGGVKLINTESGIAKNLMESAQLKYQLFIPDTGIFKVHIQLSPTLDFQNKGGLLFGISVNDDNPIAVNIHTDSNPANWNSWVGNNCIETITTINFNKRGINTLNISCFDTEIIFHKVSIDLGGIKKSYLGPPNTFQKK